MRRKLAAGTLALGLAAFATAAQAANGVYAPVGRSAGSHTEVAGDITLKGVADSKYLGGTYQWNCGEGTLVPSDPATVTNAAVLEGFSCPNSAGTYTATLTVTTADLTETGTAQYTYNVLSAKPADGTADAKTVAVEKGLWWSHKYLYRAPDNRTAYFRWDWAQEAATVLVAQAFVDLQYTLSDTVTGPLPGESAYYADPYREDVRLMLNYLTDKLDVMSIATNPGSPEATLAQGNTLADGRGVYFRGNEKEYEFGAVLQLLSTCGLRTTTLTLSNSTVAGSSYAWTFNQVAQQMVDWLAWAMLNTSGTHRTNDYGTAQPTKVTQTQFVRGSWPYWAEGWDPGRRGDSSLAWWTVRGIKAAVTNMGAVIAPNSVSTGIKRNLNAFYNTTAVRRTSTTPSQFRAELYFGPDQCYHLVERAGQALLVFNWLGNLSSVGGTNWTNTTTTSPIPLTKTYLVTNWLKHNYAHSQSHPNTVCALTAACPTPSAGPTAASAGCWSHFTENTATQSLVYYTGDAQLEPDVPGAVVRWEESFASKDTLNIFAFLTITTGLEAIGQPLTGIDHASLYRRLLTKNQLGDGAWTDNGWSNGDPWATAWALSVLSRL